MYPTSVVIFTKERNDIKTLLKEGTKTKQNIKDFFLTQFMLQTSCYLITEEHKINLLDTKYVDLSNEYYTNDVLIQTIERHNLKHADNLKPSDFCMEDLRLAKSITSFNKTIVTILLNEYIDLVKELATIAEN
jgi:hypothetical protein